MKFIFLRSPCMTLTNDSRAEAIGFFLHWQKWQQILVVYYWPYGEAAASAFLWSPRWLSAPPSGARLPFHPLLRVLHALLVFVVAAWWAAWGWWFNFWPGSRRLDFAFSVLLIHGPLPWRWQQLQLAMIVICQVPPPPLPFHLPHFLSSFS